MTFTQYKPEMQDDGLDRGTVIRDETGKMAVVAGRYAAGIRWIYVLVYMDYTLRETNSMFGQWAIGDRRCSETQLVTSLYRAFDSPANSLQTLSGFALRVLGIDEVVRPTCRRHY